MKTILLILGLVGLGLQTFGQERTSPREATAVEMVSATAGSGVYVSPRRMGSNPSFNVTNSVTYYYGTNIQGTVTFLRTSPAWPGLTNGTWKYAVTNTTGPLVWYTNANDTTNVLVNDINNSLGFGYWALTDTTNDTDFTTLYFYITSSGAPDGQAITNVWLDGSSSSPTNFFAYSGTITKTNSFQYFTGNMSGGYLFGVTNFLLNPFQYNNSSQLAWGIWASNTTGSLVPLVAFSQEGTSPSMSGTESVYGGDFGSYSIAHHLYNSGRYFGVSLVWWLQDPTRDNRAFIIKGQAFSNIVNGAGLLFETHAATNSYGSHGIFNNPLYFTTRGEIVGGDLGDISDSGTDNLETNVFATLTIIPSGSRWAGSTSSVPFLAVFPQTNLVVIPTNSFEYDGNTLWLDDSNQLRKAVAVSENYRSTMPTAVTVGASPFTFSNSTPDRLEVWISDTAAFSMTKGGVQVASNIVQTIPFILQPTNVVVLTYASTIPGMKTNAW